MAPSPPSPSSRPLPLNKKNNDNDGAQPQRQQPQAQAQLRAGKRKRIMDDNHNHNHNHNNHKKNKKKKKEQQLKQYGVDLPDIPGIPVQIIPLHIHAIQTATKLFQRDQQDSIVLPYYEQEQEEATTTTTRLQNNYESSSLQLQLQQQSANHNNHHHNHHNKDVMETVFDRLSEAESKQQVTTDEIRKTTERRVRTKDAIQSWLQAIHRWIQDHPPSSSTTTTTRTTTTTNDDKYDPPPPTTDTKHCSSRKTSVPICVLKHLLELILEHDRMAVRRAATHAMGHLLQKSADCRSWLFHQGGSGTDSTTITTITTSTAPNRRLLSWMDEVMGLNNDHDDNHDQQLPIRLLLQQETYRLLQKLEHDGYGELFYPTLPIAVQRFQQFCPQAATALPMSAAASVSSHTNDVERRRTIRDLAMQQYEVEEKRVQKLIHRAHVYMDILVPRFGICDDDDYDDSKKDKSNETKVASTSHPDTGKQENSRDNDEEAEDDDEDSIDWEDGFYDNNHCSDEENVGELEQNETSHEEAVERTLAVMKSTGGLHNGSLEIDFDRTNHEVTTTGPNNSLSLTRQKFEQVVERLAKRHMSRLSVWADCLIAADTLVKVRRRQQQQNGGGGGCCTTALMVMTSEQAKRRSDALQCITTLKTQVASILRSAQRLGIDQSKQQQQQMGPPAVGRTSVIHLSNHHGNPIKKHKRLATTLIRQRRNFKTATNQSIRHNSSRIQIKYRKT